MRLNLKTSSAQAQYLQTVTLIVVSSPRKGCAYNIKLARIGPSIGRSGEPMFSIKLDGAKSDGKPSELKNEYGFDGNQPQIINISKPRRHPSSLCLKPEEKWAPSAGSSCFELRASSV